MAAPALYEEYKTRIVEALRNSQGYKNTHQVPKVSKVVVNTCINAGLADYKQALEDAKNELTTITGQKPAETRSKKSIANFKLRQDQAIGAKVTLRGSRMWAVITSPTWASRVGLPITPIILAMRAPVLSATSSLERIWSICVRR